MRIAIATAAAALLSLSTLAYADDNSSSVGGGKGTGIDKSTTNSTRSGSDTPDQQLKDKCLAGTATKEECAGLPQQ